MEGGHQGSLSEEEDATTVPILSSYSLNNPDKRSPKVLSNRVGLGTGTGKKDDEEQKWKQQ